MIFTIAANFYAPFDAAGDVCSVSLTGCQKSLLVFAIKWNSRERKLLFERWTHSIDRTIHVRKVLALVKVADQT